MQDVYKRQVFALCACGNGDKDKDKDGDKAKIKVGFIFLHDENSTYDLNFMNRCV